MVAATAPLRLVRSAHVSAVAFAALLTAALLLLLLRAGKPTQQHGPLASTVRTAWPSQRPPGALWR